MSSPDGRWLAFASRYRTVQLQDSKTRALKETCNRHSKDVMAVSSNQIMTQSSYSIDEDRTWIMWRGHSVLSTLDSTRTPAYAPDGPR